jgi:hypothetical protein
VADFYFILDYYNWWACVCSTYWGERRRSNEVWWDDTGKGLTLAKRSGTGKGDNLANEDL